MKKKINMKVFASAFIMFSFFLCWSHQTAAQSDHHYYWMTFEVLNTADFSAAKASQLQTALMGKYGVKFVEVDLSNHRINLVMQDDPKRTGYDSFKSRLTDIFGMNVLKVDLLRDIKYDISADPLQVFAKPVNPVSTPDTPPALEFIEKDSD